MTYREKDINLDLADYLKTFLNEYEGVEVISTRTSDTTVSLANRTVFAEEHYADYVISLHNNASSDGTARFSGSMVLVTCSHYEPESTTLSGGKTIYQESENLALTILKYLQKMNLPLSSDLGTEANGLLRRTGGSHYPDGSVSDYYAILRQGVVAGIPSILVEHGYMDNQDEFEKYLMTDDERKALARSDARAIAEYFGLQLKPAEDAQDSPFADDGQFVVAIDPGYGGTETGAQSTWNGVTYLEKDLNWKIADKLKAELSTYQNVVPVLTKGEDDTLDGLTRFQNVLSQNPDLFFSIGNNAAGAENTGAHGSTAIITDSHYRADGSEGGIYTGEAKVNDLYDTEEGLAEAVLDRLQGLGLSTDPTLNDGSGLVRRLWKQDTFTAADGAPDTWYPNGDEADYYEAVYYGSRLGIPSMIVKHAYMDNRSDFETYLASDGALQELAHADALAIADYYNLEKEGTEPEITTATLPSGKVQTAYRQTLAANGDTPITWSVESGRLPTGLTLSEAGVISGTPTASGTYSFTVKAENGAGSDTKTLSLTIRPRSSGGSGSGGGSNPSTPPATPPATPPVTVGSSGQTAEALAAINTAPATNGYINTAAVNAIGALGFASDTTANLDVNSGYQLRLTSSTGAVPTVTVGTPGVFDVKLIQNADGSYFVQMIPIGQPGAQTGVYVNGIRLLVAMAGESGPAVRSDTTKPLQVKAGTAYTFKLTADAQPNFVAGTAGVYNIELVRVSGRDYFFRITAIGRAGQSAGFYINGSKIPVTVATVSQ